MCLVFVALYLYFFNFRITKKQKTIHRDSAGIKANNDEPKQAICISG